MSQATCPISLLRDEIQYQKVWFQASGFWAVIKLHCIHFWLKAWLLPGHSMAVVIIECALNKWITKTRKESQQTNPSPPRGHTGACTHIHQLKRTEPDLLIMKMRRPDFYFSYVTQIMSFCFSFNHQLQNGGGTAFEFSLTLWALWVMPQSLKFWMWTSYAIYNWHLKRITRSNNEEGTPSVLFLYETTTVNTSPWESHTMEW